MQVDTTRLVVHRSVFDTGPVQEEGVPAWVLWYSVFGLFVLAGLWVVMLALI